MIQEVEILRDLARSYADIAFSRKNEENIKLHKAVNDLRMIRPIVLIDELPWNEMNIGDELTLRCTDPFLREIEWYLRTNIYKNKYFPADMIVTPFIPVNKVVHSTGWGLTVEEEVLETDENSNIKSHHYKDILRTEADLEKLHNPVLTYDKEETLKRFNLLGEMVGDIIPIRLRGTSFFGVAHWDTVALYRGVTNLLIDLADRPEFMHKIVQKLTEITLSIMKQSEELELLDHNNFSLHCTAIHTKDLSCTEDKKMTRKDVWGRGMAQIFASVSKDMHEEFDIPYMIKTIGQCGLAYYGCCEPLDKKIDIVEKIPNLRKISITPWADVDIAAEAINKKYVLASKPSPSAVAVPMLDQENLKKEIKKILDACKRNHCSCDIVLKDISTCCKRPQNIFEWEQIVMDMVKNY